MQITPSPSNPFSTQLSAIRKEAGRLVQGLPPALGVWRAHPSAWSVAQCFDHLARFNQAYLKAIQTGLQAAEPIQAGPADSRSRLLGRLFIRSMEPPVKPLLRTRSPAAIVPCSEVSLAAAFAAFSQSHQDVEDFVESTHSLPIARIKFTNPFLKAIRLTLATGFGIIAVHERRHLWQARQILKLARTVAK